MMKNRCAALIAFLIVVPLLFGCAENSLDLPMDSDLLEGDGMQSAPEADLPPAREAASTPSAGHEPQAATVESTEPEPPQPSTVRSIFNALKNGAANALDEPNGSVE